MGYVGVSQSLGDVHNGIDVQRPCLQIPSLCVCVLQLPEGRTQMKSGYGRVAVRKLISGCAQRFAMQEGDGDGSLIS